MLKYNKLSKKLLEICAKKNMKLLTAESCTGGLLSANITGIAGSQMFFHMASSVIQMNQKRIS